ncbi:hypothetical protein SCALM49S_07660 [Streptomyces californicus]
MRPLVRQRSGETAARPRTDADAPARRGRYLTGRWYAIRYRSAGTTTSAVSTARPEA